MPDDDFDVFLSHNSKDKPAVRQIAEALRDRRGLKVWLDEWDLPPGVPWQDEFETIIGTVRTVAALIGENGVGPWEKPEIEGALIEAVRRGVPVIPVVLPNAPADIKLPLFLKRFTWVDLRGGITEEGLDRLEWGITGKRPARNTTSFAPNRSPIEGDYPRFPRIFISYSHQDEIWKNRLVTHLSVLEQENLLEVWSDRKISTGDEWLYEIQKAMKTASLAVLLISANFLVSPFIRSKEVPKLLERRSSEGMTIFPIIIGSCAWRKVSWLSSLQARPLDGRPLSSRRGDRIDAELSAIVEEIADLLSHLR